MKILLLAFLLLVSINACGIPVLNEIGQQIESNIKAPTKEPKPVPQLSDDLVKAYFDDTVKNDEAEKP
ncbi:hypothetical protein [Shewanella woodyi]|uniref:hypothetical protein n=1 Tax=Shewanella woodyi TaxID=60961 RepID=UPI00374A850E